MRLNRRFERVAWHEAVVRRHGGSETVFPSPLNINVAQGNFNNGGHVPTVHAGSPAMLKLSEAAKYLSLSPITVRRMVKQGRLKRHPAFRHIVIPRTSLDKFVAEAGQ